MEKAVCRVQAAFRVICQSLKMKEETMKKPNALQELTRTPMSGVWSFSHGLSSHTLKIIAITTMLIDHIAAVLMEGQASYWTLREIGRISFPIFCFLAAEGIAWDE